MDDTILKIIDRSVKNLPKDLPVDKVSSARMELFRRLRKSARRAAKAYGLFLYIPVERIHGAYVPASFVVSRPITGKAKMPSDGLLREVTVGRSEVESVTVDGAEGARTEGVEPPKEDAEFEHPYRRVEYAILIPNLTAVLTLTFSTIGDGNPHSEFSDALVDIFDASMTTFRWSYA